MSEPISVIVPVLNGMPLLQELLDAVRREGVDELLVIDSGSRDGSVDAARTAGARVVEIAPEAFGHGRTRDLAAREATGDVLAFLTQDATPVEGWLEALREALALSADVGAVFGPHRPRPETSPMIARELDEWFSAVFGPHDARPHVTVDEVNPYLSNVNTAYRRACLDELGGFGDLPYAEDQDAGRRLAAHPRWVRAYAPAFAVLHAHDYPPAEFARRYFDEYRGLRQSLGHREVLGVRSTVRQLKTQVSGDARWLDDRGVTGARRARWLARSAAHHASRKAAAVLGTRAHKLPPRVQRRLSLEGTVVTQAPAVSRATSPGAQSADEGFGPPIARIQRDGPAPLLAPQPGQGDRGRLRCAFVIPPFGIGSGGHNIIFQLIVRLERAGHVCSVWIVDPHGERAHESAATTRDTIREHFAPIDAAVHKNFAAWHGADVVVATGWQTVAPALALGDVRARAYLINDHEVEFYPTSVESRWAAWTYDQGLYGICGSPWLRELYEDRYGGRGGTFQYGVDHAVYRVREEAARRDDTVAFYARHVTPRRAVPLGILALEELVRRRPQTRVVAFGGHELPPMRFPHESAGVAGADALARLFNEATVGLCLSLTNYSLIPNEMLACGLPCVDLEGRSAESVFGADGPVELVEFDPYALADALERLLDDPQERARRSAAGLAVLDGRTWDAAAVQVERELRNALRVAAGEPAQAG